MRKNATLDIGRSLRQIIIGVSLFLEFLAIRKSEKYGKIRLVPKQDLFHASSSIKGSVELSGKLMQEIHQIWNELEAILYFVLITIKGMFTFLLAKNTRNKLTTKICFELLLLSNVVFLICESSPTLMSHFFLILTIFKTPI